MEDTFNPSLVEESSSSSSATPAKDPDHGLQKVTYAKRRRHLQNAADPNHHHPNGLPLINDSYNVFATVEQKAQERRRALEATAAAVTEATVAAPRPKSASGASNNEDNDSGSEAHPGGQENGEVAKKVKQKKPKKPKVTVHEAAAKVNAADLGAFLIKVSDSFESQPDIQLMRFADYFARSFGPADRNSRGPRCSRSPMFPRSSIIRTSPSASVVSLGPSFHSALDCPSASDQLGLGLPARPRICWQRLLLSSRGSPGLLPVVFSPASFPSCPPSSQRAPISTATFSLSPSSSPSFAQASSRLLPASPKRAPDSSAPGRLCSPRSLSPRSLSDPTSGK